MSERIERMAPYSKGSKGKGTSKGKHTPNFEALGQPKGGKLQRIWELAEIEEQDYATWEEKKLRSQERLREACELMQQIFDMEKEHEEQQARQGSSSIINENENSSEPTSVFEYIPSP